MYIIEFYVIAVRGRLCIINVTLLLRNQKVRHKIIFYIVHATLLFHYVLFWYQKKIILNLKNFHINCEELFFLSFLYIVILIGLDLNYICFSLHKFSYTLSGVKELKTSRDANFKYFDGPRRFSLPSQPV